MLIRVFKRYIMFPNCSSGLQENNTHQVETASFTMGPEMKNHLEQTGT